MKRKRKNKRIHQLPVYSPDNDLLWSHEPESELDVIQTFYQGEAQPNGLTTTKKCVAIKQHKAL